MKQVQIDIKRKELETQNKYTKIEKLNKQIFDLTAKLQVIDDQKLNIEEKAKELKTMIQVFI